VLESRPGSWTIGQLTDPVLDVEPLHCLSNGYPDSMAKDRLLAPVYPLDGTGNPGFVQVVATGSGLTVSVMDANGVLKTGVVANGTVVPMQIVKGN